MEPCALGSTQPLKIRTRKTSGDKDGRCVRVTTLPPSQCRMSRRSGNLNLPDPQGPAQACSGKTLPLTYTKEAGIAQLVPAEWGNAIRARAGELHVLQSVQTGSIQPPIQMDSGVYFSVDKAVAAWSWPLISIQCLGENEFSCTYFPICLPWIHGNNLPHREHTPSSSQKSTSYCYFRNNCCSCEKHTRHVTTLCGQNVEFSWYATKRWYI
jgi:hypothetical protein